MPKTTDRTAWLTVRLAPEMQRQIRKAARAEDLTIAQFVRRAIARALKDGL